MPSPSHSRSGSGRRKGKGTGVGGSGVGNGNARRARKDVSPVLRLLPFLSWSARRLSMATALVLGIIAGFVWIGFRLDSRTPAGRLRAAEAASKAKDWPKALAAWRLVNATDLRKGSTHFAEARAAMALGKVGEAEDALVQSTLADPANPEPWQLLLELLRVEDRPIEALEVGWGAYSAVLPKDRRTILRDLTLALLADLPDDLARDTLSRWSDSSEGSEPDARVALLQRMASMPRAGDPDRLARITELTRQLHQNPDHPGIREALINALADNGDNRQGEDLLNGWPVNKKDARYWRLKGRWDLEYGHQPAEAVKAFEIALESLPNDWKTRSRLARALQIVGKTADAKREAETVGRIREVLDPNRLGQRLANAIERLDDPKALRDLADLTQKAGLEQLAEAWLREADHPAADNFTINRRLGIGNDRSPGQR